MATKKHKRHRIGKRKRFAGTSSGRGSARWDRRSFPGRWRFGDEGERPPGPSYVATTFEHQAAMRTFLMPVGRSGGVEFLKTAEAEHASGSVISQNCQ